MNKRKYAMMAALFLGFLFELYDSITYYLIDNLEGWIPLAEHFGMEG